MPATSLSKPTDESSTGRGRFEFFGANEGSPPVWSRAQHVISRPVPRPIPARRWAAFAVASPQLPRRVAQAVQLYDLPLDAEVVRRVSTLALLLDLHLPALARGGEVSFAESGSGAVLLESTRIFAEILVRPGRPGYDLYLEHRATGATADITNESVFGVVERIGRADSR